MAVITDPGEAVDLVALACGDDSAAVVATKKLLEIQTHIARHQRLVLKGGERGDRAREGIRILLRAEQKWRQKVPDEVLSDIGWLY
jgi:hypothetical protein